MLNKTETVTILVADNDPGDRLLIQEALAERGDNFELHFVENEEELLAYLYQAGKYAQPSSSPRPNLIILELNMTHSGKKAALEKIRGTPSLCRIPVIVLTSACGEEQVACNYSPGGNSYISKPNSFEQLVDLIEIIDRYWFEVVKLPDWSLIEAID